MKYERHLSYAQGYLELGLLAEAAAELDRIPAPECTSSATIGIRMAILHEQQNWHELGRVAADFAGRHPEESSAWVTWAYAVRRSVSLEVAEKILLDAERHHPTDATIQFNLGCYACVREDLVAAERRVDRAIAVEEKFRESAATDPDLELLRAAKPKKYRVSGEY